MRIFRTFICIKRIPLSPLSIAPLPFISLSPIPSLPTRRLLSSASQKHFYFLFYPSIRDSTRILIVSLLCVLLPLFIVSFSPSPQTSSPSYTAYLLFVFLQGSRISPPPHSNISSTLSLNLVLQVTISLDVSSAMFFLAVIPYFYCFSLTPLCSLLSSPDTSLLFFCIR